MTTSAPQSAGGWMDEATCTDEPRGSVRVAPPASASTDTGVFAFALPLRHGVPSNVISSVREPVPARFATECARFVEDLTAVLVTHGPLAEFSRASGGVGVAVTPALKRTELEGVEEHPLCLGAGSS